MEQNLMQDIDMQYIDMQYIDMQYNQMEQNKSQSVSKAENIYGVNIELVEWLKTLSKQEEIFITIKLKENPRLTKKELGYYLMIEKENAEIYGYGDFGEYLSDTIFYDNLKITEAYKPDNLFTDIMPAVNSAKLTLRDSAKNKYKPNEKITCFCGKTYTKTNKSRHFKTWHK